jgi:rhamnosyl/mannosyltransferase
MRLYQPLFEKFLNRVDQVIATSPNYARSSAVLTQIPPAKLRTVPFGINLDLFQRPCQKEVSALKERFGPRVVTFVGKLRYYKGLEYLIQAAREVEATFLIIGEGPQNPQLRRLASDNGCNGKVIFLGEIDNQSLVNYLYASEVFVLPSIYRSEAFGISMLEAMACGLPIISTELETGTSYVNQHGKTGLVVPPADAAALARAINRLLENPDLNRSMGQAGLQRIKNEFTHIQMLARLKEIYQV